MKKLLGLALAVASIGTVGLASEAKANEAANNSVTVATYANAQWQRDRYGRRIYNRRRTVRRTRVVRVGRRLYRETYVVSYLPNGRVLDTRLISRVRIS
jgi:opacity protein-like surface antigen